MSLKVTNSIEKYLTSARSVSFELIMIMTHGRYRHFEAEIVHNARFDAERLAVDFPQRFIGYERSPQLELWRITARAAKTAAQNQ